MKKNLNPSFLTPLNDGAHYADRNEPKQPQVCTKNLQLQLIQVFRFSFKNIKIQVAWGTFNYQYLSKIFYTWCFYSEEIVLKG